MHQGRALSASRLRITSRAKSIEHMSTVIRASYSRAGDGSLIVLKSCKASPASCSMSTSSKLLKDIVPNSKLPKPCFLKIHAATRDPKQKLNKSLQFHIQTRVLEIVSLIVDGSRRLSHKRMQSKRNSGL